MATEAAKNEAMEKLNLILGSVTRRSEAPHPQHQESQ